MSVENALQDVAAALGVAPDSLKKLIAFESGFNPSATNKFTGARGLIQFMPATARSLGFKDANDLVDRFPDAEGQLRGPVLQYLKKFAPFNSAQSLYMAVFYPAFRDVPPDTVFSDSVKKVNPGISTVQDYINKVEKKNVILSRQYSPAWFLLLPVLSAGAYLYFKFKHLKGGGENDRGKNGGH